MMAASAGEPSASSGVRRKRRPKNGCPNPLFVKWVEEWRDEAKEKGLKCHHSYTKALTSLKRYPLPLSSGEEAKILDYVGAKLAQMIDKRLAEHLADGGSLDHTTDSMTSSGICGEGKERKNLKPNSELAAATFPMQSSSSLKTSRVKTPNRRQSGGGGGGGDSPGPAKKMRKSSPREYVPVYRSGPYAILIALYRAEESPSYPGYMHKSQVISASQPYCDASFTIPEEGSHYTAWSSMSSMIKRGLIKKTSHPPRFSLTDTGVSLAMRLEQGSATAEALPSTPCSRVPRTTLSHPGSVNSPIALVSTPPSSPPSDMTDTYHLTDTDEDAGVHGTDGCDNGDMDWDISSNEHDNPLPTRTEDDLTSELKFWYVDSGGQHVLDKDSAVVTFNEVVSVGFLIKCHEADLHRSNLTYTLDNCRKQEGPYVFVYLCNDDAPDLCTPPDEDQSGSTTKSTDIWLSDKLTSVTHLPHSSITCTPTDKKNPTCTSTTNKPPTFPTYKTSPTFPATMNHNSPTKPGSPIILSDDSDSDVEIVPLAERIGLSRLPGKDVRAEGPAKRSQDEPTPPTRNNDAMSPPTREVIPYSSDENTCTEGLSSSGWRLGSGRGERRALTPAQAAGMAALRRLEGSNFITQEDSGTNIPIFDLTGDESDGDSTSKSESLSSGAKVKAIHSDMTQLCDLTNTDSHTTSQHEKPVNNPMQDSCLKSGVPLGGSSAATNQGPPPMTTDSCASSIQTIPRPASSGNNLSSISGACSLQSSQDDLLGSQRSSNEAIDLASPEFVLRPGQFEVVLCVDNSESTASRKSSSHFRGLLLQELGKNGVKFDVRKLNVGDFVWVAREKVTPLPGQLVLPISREIALEYVVERKRMDDLAGSIIDGRFHEQKFRLKNCGLPHSVYLVEEYGDVSHLKLTERALEQAITNTQVISGFFVKRTKDIRESVAYLTILTRFLQKHYSSKTLKAYPWDVIVQLNRCSSIQRDQNTTCSMPFNKFNEASVKNKVLTVYEMYGRHLIQLPQFSAEKAVAILERYPTVSHLREAYRQCKTESERGNMVSNIRVGPCKRKLGPNLSHMVYALYWNGV